MERINLIEENLYVIHTEIYLRAIEQFSNVSFCYLIYSTADTHRIRTMLATIGFGSDESNELCTRTH